MKKLNIYFAAGIPGLEDTSKIAELIQRSGADMMEIGIPYSDPVADGPIIQKAHAKSLKNGITLEILFTQLFTIKDTVTVPKILMGYLNTILQFGFENFCKKCSETGISGLIIPDLPPFEYVENYRKIVEKYSLHFSFLITPETPPERVKYLDKLSSGFLYAVSASSTTGNENIMLKNEQYLNGLASLPLKNPVMVGFGIKSKSDFLSVTENLWGGIIGSAFVKILLEEKNWEEKAASFIREIKG
ncbi:MAG: tryptophan synthase subunit alpha [Bergeyella sp.]|nr:tryptophan synthase subunit alpha [Bergeyella sp.]